MVSLHDNPFNKNEKRFACDYHGQNMITNMEKVILLQKESMYGGIKVGPSLLES